jgi:hypothetical protein
MKKTGGRARKAWVGGEGRRKERGRERGKRRRVMVVFRPFIMA